jgi:hypothetical protein
LTNREAGYNLLIPCLSASAGRQIAWLKGGSLEE